MAPAGRGGGAPAQARDPRRVEDDHLRDGPQGPNGDPNPNPNPDPNPNPNPNPNPHPNQVPTETGNASKYFDSIFDAHRYTKHIARHTPGGKHHWFSDGYHVDGQTNNELNAYMVRDLWGEHEGGGGISGSLPFG